MSIPPQIIDFARTMTPENAADFLVAFLKKTSSLESGQSSKIEAALNKETVSLKTEEDPKADKPNLSSVVESSPSKADPPVNVESASAKVVKKAPETDKTALPVESAPLKVESAPLKVESVAPSAKVEATSDEIEAASAGVRADLCKDAKIYWYLPLWEYGRCRFGPLCFEKKMVVRGHTILYHVQIKRGLRRDIVFLSKK